MFLMKQFLSLVVLVLLFLAMPALAADGENAETAAEPTNDAAPADDVDALIKQLDDDAFSEREAASRKLGAEGKAAIPALRKAATSDSLEVATRSMRILRKLFASPDKETKAAARKALEKVAGSKHPSAARAKETLRPPQPELPLRQPGNIAAIAVRKTISISNVNGVKTISVDENGRKTKIKDDPKQGITVEVTETKGGKQVTKTTKAKNADELKKKDKEAYDLYKQYSKGGAMRGIQFRIQGGAIPGGIQIIPGGGIQIRPAMPRGPGQRIQLVPGGAKIDPAKRIEAATRQLRRLGAELDKAIDDADEAGELHNALEQFQKELEKQLAELEKQLKQQDK